MRLGWFGIPWYGYAAACLLLAIGYAVFAIDPTKGYNWTSQPIWRLIILRWFHSLVWVLLAVACLIMQFRGEQGTNWAKSVSLLGLLVYLTYLLFLVIVKRR